MCQYATLWSLTNWPRRVSTTHPQASTCRSARRDARSPPRAPHPRQRAPSRTRGRTWGSARATLRDKLSVRVTNVSLFRFWPRSSTTLRQWLVHWPWITYSHMGAAPRWTELTRSHVRTPPTLWTQGARFRPMHVVGGRRYLPSRIAKYFWTLRKYSPVWPVAVSPRSKRGCAMLLWWLLRVSPRGWARACFSSKWTALTRIRPTLVPGNRSQYGRLEHSGHPCHFDPYFIDEIRIKTLTLQTHSQIKNEKSR